LQEYFLNYFFFLKRVANFETPYLLNTPHRYDVHYSSKSGKHIFWYENYSNEPYVLRGIHTKKGWFYNHFPCNFPPHYFLSGLCTKETFLPSFPYRRGHANIVYQLLFTCVHSKKTTQLKQHSLATIALWLSLICMEKK